MISMSMVPVFLRMAPAIEFQSVERSTLNFDWSAFLVQICSELRVWRGLWIRQFSMSWNLHIKGVMFQLLHVNPQESAGV